MVNPVHHDRCGSHSASEVVVVSPVHHDRCGHHSASEIVAVNPVHQRLLWSTLCIRDRCGQPSHIRDRCGQHCAAAAGLAEGSALG